MKKQLIFTIALFLCSLVANASDIQLKFNKKGQFKIAQFTDLHWIHGSPNSIKTAETIKHVLETEKPDVAILSGDVVWKDSVKEGWLTVAKIFEEAKTPWAITLGNHDSEDDLTRDGVFEFLEGMPYYIGEQGEELTGCGNYSLPILSSQGSKIAAVLYCVDSNDYPADQKLGHYDWIHFDQIDWYRKTSDKYTAQNNGKPLPSLAFFHIPLPEYKEIIGKDTTHGAKNEEGVSSPVVNSGFFCSLMEKGDVMGTFVGHDHDNNYIGILHDIALAYGRVTGADAYGDFERGARIITMYEGENQFDTWIRTKSGTDLLYYYPSGISAQEEASAQYMPAIKTNPKKQGVAYTYYEGRIKSTDRIASLTPLKTGIINNISLAPASAQDSFAFEFKTLIKILERGMYRFYTHSDDGSKLFINGKLVVDNDGSHNARRREGKIALEAGYHELKVLYFEDYMGESLEVGISSRSILEIPIPDNMLYVPEK
ncbi:PA14 domain-containing protein [Dysgonomonas sp. ZJ709]|uniref:PA14 domain-containing protein n=1 Tax=Dysgonomonas sp. ZJ709 TaxID=2709797 RepID=UPI0013EBA218|nr:PA14 domain-containing protein [Dysgonomonas sp. ZJ709]